MYRSVGSANSGSPDRRARGEPATPLSLAPAPRPAVAAAYAVICAPNRGSGVMRLVDVGLLAHPRLVELFLGARIDAAVPEQAAAAPLFVLERRPLGLQLLDEGGDV